LNDEVVFGANNMGLWCYIYQNVTICSNMILSCDIIFWKIVL